MAANRLVQEAAQLGALGLPAYVGRPLHDSRPRDRGLLPPDDLVQPPPLGEALQAKAAPVDELEVLCRPDDGPDGFGHQDLAAFGLGYDPGGSVHRRAEQVPLLPDSLSRVEADAHLHLLVRVPTVVLLQRSLDGDGTFNGLASRGEGHHEAIPYGLDLLAAVLRDLLSDQLEVGVNNLMGGRVAPARPQAGGADDVSEEDGDGALRKLAGHGR